MGLGVMEFIEFVEFDTPNTLVENPLTPRTQSLTPSGANTRLNIHAPSKWVCCTN